MPPVLASHTLRILRLAALWLLAQSACAATINLSDGGNLVLAVAEVQAQGGGTVNLGPGTYVIAQSVQLNGGITINGAGPSTVVTRPPGAQAFSMFVNDTEGISNVTISNLVIDGGIPKSAFGVGAFGGAGIYLFAYTYPITQVTVSNVEIRNLGLGLLWGVVNFATIDHVYVHDNNPGGFAHNAYLVSCTAVTISHSRFDRAWTGDGLHVDFYGSQINVSKSEFSNNNGIGLLGQDPLQALNVTDSIFNFNTNDGLDTSMPNSVILRNQASYNGGYGMNVNSSTGPTVTQSLFGFGDGQGIGFFYGSFSNFGFGTTANQYLAVEQDGVTGPVDSADWTTAYGGGSSGMGVVDFNANHLTNGQLAFNRVGAVSAGSYPVLIQYSNGTKGALSMPLTVNGAAAGTVSFPSTGAWTTFSSVTLPVNLQQGNNAIVLTPSGTSAPEIDYLQVQTPTPAPPPAPAAPSVTIVDAYTAKIGWSAVPTASYYNIYRNGGLLATNVVGTSYTDSSLLFGGTTATYSVAAINQGGGSSASAAPTVQFPPDAPAGLALSTPSSTGNVLSWYNPSNTTGYLVQRAGVHGGPYSTIATISNTTGQAQAQSYTDTTAGSGVNWFYVLQSVAGQLTSVPTYEVGAVPSRSNTSFSLGSTPAALTVAQGGSASVAINVAPIAGFTGAVALSTSGLPTGLTATAGAVSANSGAVTVTASSTVPAGAYTLTVTGTSGSSVATQNIVVTVAALSPQTINFGPIATQTVAIPLALTATASSGLPVIYGTATPTVCTVSGSTANFVAAGTCAIVAFQLGNGSYASAAPVPQTFSVVVSTLKPQSISFAGFASATVGQSGPVTATASSGLPVSVVSSTPTVCTINGATASAVGAGTCTLQASQTGNAVYAPANPVSVSFPVTLLAQKIIFASIAGATVGQSGTLPVSASSGLPVSVSSSTPAVCSAAGTTATALATGTCTLVASQAGNGSYAAALPVSESFPITLAPQIINFGTIPTVPAGTSGTLPVAASSGLTVVVTSATPAVCTVKGLVGTALAGGTCTLTATQAGNASYAAASPVTVSFTVTP